MSSGVAIDPSCNEMWEDFHLGKVNKRRVITFRINDAFNVSLSYLPFGQCLNDQMSFQKRNNITFSEIMV